MRVNCSTVHAQRLLLNTRSVRREKEIKKPLLVRAGNSKMVLNKLQLVLKPKQISVNLVVLRQNVLDSLH